MAKRRNPKKEKALRNRAYARRFRKQTTQGRFGRKRFFRENRPEDEQAQTYDKSPDSEKSAEMDSF